MRDMGILYYKEYAIYRHFKYDSKKITSNNIHNFFGNVCNLMYIRLMHLDLQFILKADSVQSLGF